MPYDELPEPFASALRAHRPEDVADHDAGTAAARFARGLARLALGRDADARLDFDAALPELGAGPLIELALLDIRERNALEPALACAAEVLGAAPEGSRLQARALHVTGLAQGKLRRNVEAANALFSALELYRELGERDQVAQVQDTLGSLYASKGRLDLATSHYALSIVEKALCGDRAGIAITLGNLGRLHLRAGRFLDALDCFRQDLRLAEENGDPRGVARMQEDLGRAYHGLERRDEARASFEACLATAAEHGFDDLAFFAWKDLALLHAAEGRHEEAQAALRSARDALAGKGEPYLETVLLAARGELLLARDDPHALDTIEDAVRRFAAEELPDFEIPALLALTEALARMRYKATAEQCLRRALARARRDGYARYLPAIREATARLALVPGAVDEAGMLRVEGGRPVGNEDGYTVLEKIGEGGFGDVWYALDQARDRYVAIKYLRLQKSYSPEARRRALTSARIELEAASRIRHDGVARVFAVGSDSEDRHYVVQEFVDGLPLRSAMVEHEPGPPDQVATILADLAEALAALHERGVVHRDLKPENVLLREGDGRPVLIDFGIAYLPDSPDPDEGRFLAGSLGYMAPEQCAGEPVGPSADVFALGVIAYEWLSGRRPLELESSSVTEQLEERQQAQPAPLAQVRPDLPAPVHDLVDAMLARDPEARPTAAAIPAACHGWGSSVTSESD